jgi:hypothetical protein
MPITQTFDPIHSYIASSSVSSVTFSSINQNYDHLCITGGFTRSLSGDFGGRSADFQWNGVSSGYKFQWFYGANGSNAIASQSTSGGTGPNAPAGNINDQGGRQAWEIWIPNYRSTRYQKHILMKQGNNDTAANNGGFVGFSDNLIPISTALTSLVISELVDTFVAGDWVTIYGVKNA